jgi:uncharacterized protein (TIGR03437 family)
MRWILAVTALSGPGLLAQEVRAVEAASGITAPTIIAHAGDGSGRLFLAEQAGRIRILQNGALLAQPFLDIRSRVACCGERGLLGLAFPPGYAQSGRFYVHYSDLAGDTVIALYRVSPDPNVADPASERILLSVDQPFANHNGGQLAFGPDGYLYIGLGDGGSAGDPQNNAQRLSTLLGKILRVDVEGEPGSVRIPPGNPFVSTSGARGEIWALGLRNPWRFSFDRELHDLWIGDVGQNQWEEIDFQPAASGGGENYGWRILEGTHCYNPATNCNTQGLTLPVHEYNHGAGACSVTGGHVYRGRRSPALRGTYIYGDYCNGMIWGLTRDGTQFANRLLLASGMLITTFGEDEAGEVYVADARAGRIFHLQGAAAPVFSASGVVNAASFTPGLVAGSLATVFVRGVRDAEGIAAASSLPLPASLDGVSITLDGVAAPVLSVSNVNGTEQVNFQVPYQVRGRASVGMIVRRGNDASAPVTVPVLAEQPGVFTHPGGQRAVVVRNADYSLAADVSAGEYVFVYATGIGSATNEPASGAAAPFSPLAMAHGPVSVTLDGAPCEVQFAGLAPGFAGVYQVNFRVPSGVQPGTRTLNLRSGSADAPAVTLAVR